GVILGLPAVTAPVASVAGSLVFGIGTQSNNGLGSASVYTLNGSGNFTTTYKGQAYNQSFLDSGSNGLYFLTSSVAGIAVCPDASVFHFPSIPQNPLCTHQ